MSITGILLFLFLLGFYIGFHYALHRLFKDAGSKGWISFVPVVYVFEWLKIIGKPGWWFFLLLIPGVNIIIGSAMLIESVKCYGKHRLRHYFLVSVFSGYYFPYVVRNEAFLGTGKNTANGAQNPESTISQWVASTLFALAFVVFLRMFMFEAYCIPTPSMEKTLLVGDYMFVSKLNYGPRIPETPIAVPFVHHTIPGLNWKAYSTCIKLPYLRLPGFEKVKRNDMVVFNFPAGDTVVLENQGPSYYDLVRYAAVQNGLDYNTTRMYMWSDANYHIVARPVDKRENYIKRCVAIPGDKLELKNGVLFINDQPAYVPENLYLPYVVELKEGAGLPEQIIDDLQMENVDSRFPIMPAGHHIFFMSKKSADLLRTYNLTKIDTPFYYPAGQITDVFYQAGRQVPIANIFPNDLAHYQWNVDNFGPICIPKKGTSVPLNDSIYAQYERAIRVYENNTVEKKDGKYYINGQQKNSYTFKMDYYWMMGDNRHDTQDSRYWGFVPEDHITGKAWFIWMSPDSKSGNMRWDRLFTSTHGKWAPTGDKFTK